VGMGTDTREMLLQKNKNLMCYNTGGPCKPFNRPLEKVHAGLNITDKEFNVLLQYIKKALIKNHVGSQEQDELMAKIEGLRPYIVQAKEKAK
jgi:hemoglobin